MVPIPKKKLNQSSMRPVALTSLVMKAMERVRNSHRNKNKLVFSYLCLIKALPLVLHDFDEEVRSDYMYYEYDQELTLCPPGQVMV